MALLLLSTLRKSCLNVCVILKRSGIENHIGYGISQIHTVPILEDVLPQCIPGSINTSFTIILPPLHLTKLYLACPSTEKKPSKTCNLTHLHDHRKRSDKNQVSPTL